jgi:hypothetical protein
VSIVGQHGNVAIESVTDLQLYWQSYEYIGGNMKQRSHLSLYKHVPTT